MNNPQLRQYQRDVINEFHRRVDEGHRRVISVAPTGAGKTVIGAEIIGATARTMKPVLVLAHRREIIEQISRKLYGAGIAHGIIQAGFPTRPLELVQVASIQTLWARAMYRQSMDLPPAHLLVIQKSNSTPASSETLVRNIRRATRKHHAAEEKIRIVLDGLRGETSIAELCRREGIAESMYYSWSKEFLEAGKRRLAGDTARAATTDEVKQLRREAQDLKEVVAEQALELRLLKKSMIGDGGDQT